MKLEGGHLWVSPSPFAVFRAVPMDSLPFGCSPSCVVSKGSQILGDFSGGLRGGKGEVETNLFCKLIQFMVL